MWSENQYKQHVQAAKNLVRIKDGVADFLSTHPQMTEYVVMEEVERLFALYGLKMDAHRPIVAFRENTSHVHYFPEKRGSLRLKNNSLILLDIWGRLKQPQAPYADFTWMFFYGTGEPVQKYIDAFHYVRDARDLAIAHIRKELKAGRLPIGHDCDAVSRDFLTSKHMGDKFVHSLGHSLGTRSPHGVWGGLRPRTKGVLMTGMGYTVEPGVYFPRDFGIRSEVDLYITKEKKVEMTLPLQKEIQIIRPL